MSQQAPVSSPASSKFFRWHRAVLHICFIVFTAELAFCLIYLPWRSDWEVSYIPMHFPRLADVWLSPYFRGALSGLGLLNGYVALAEIARLIGRAFESSK